jgi:hypothetical protein
MAIGEIRIGVKGSGASDFSTAALGVLTLYRAGTDAPLSSRAPLGLNTALEPSIYGTTPIIGPAYTPKYLWTLAPWLTLDEALHLQALVLRQKSAGITLRLIDEVERITIDTTYNNRTLISQLTPAWGATYRTGYGVFDVHITLDGEWNQYLGLWADNSTQARGATFTAVEV